MTSSRNETNLKISVKEALNHYFTCLEGAAPANVYELVLKEVENPLIETVLKYADGNQSKAAKWLGLSRNTLRKLLAKYDIG